MNASAFRIRPARVFSYHLCVILVLTIIGITARTLIYRIAPDIDTESADIPSIARLLSRFDLGFEPSISAWFSSLAMMFTAMLLWVIGQSRQPQAPYRRHWIFLALLFTLLALDEVVMFHETLSKATNAVIGPTQGVLHFAWVIPGGIFVILLSISLLSFVWHQQPPIRWLFVCSAAVFVGGAIGMELIENVLIDAGQLSSFRFTLVQAAEESMEMLGVAIFIYALLRLLESEFRVVELGSRSSNSA